MIERIGMSRSTGGFPEKRLPDGFRLGLLSAPEVLAPVMWAAYKGTPDYEGETPQETISELREIYRGKYGALIPEACFAAYDGETPIAAVITVTENGTPLIALIFTLPDYSGKGVATSLLAAAAQALHDSGFPQIELAVNPENSRAIRIYQRLGFK